MSSRHRGITREGQMTWIHLRSNLYGQFNECRCVFSLDSRLGSSSRVQQCRIISRISASYRVTNFLHDVKLEIWKNVTGERYYPP